jgi:hypothetical protein
MITQIFLVHDEKAEVFGQPIFFENSVQAMRSFAQVANDPNSTIHLYPEEFELLQVGTYNNQTGEIIQLEKPVFVTKAKSVIDYKAPLSNSKKIKDVKNELQN